MATGRLYTLNEASSITGVNRNLAAFLVTDRCIPFQTGGPSAGQRQGRAKLLDESGLQALRDAALDYRRKAELVAC